MTQEPVVLFGEIPGQDGHRIGVACLNSERSLNSLNVPIIAALYPQLRAWALDDGIAAVFLHGSGEKAFCAGGDVKSICQAVRANGPGDRTALDLFSQEYRLDYLIHDYPKPLVVWGTGIVMGGGIGLLCGASHRVVTETSRLAMPEISIGLYPDVGGSWFLGRLGLPGLFLGLTGATFDAADALYTGFGNHAVASSRRLDVLAALVAMSWSEDRTERAGQVTALLDRFSLGELPEGHLQRNAGRIASLLEDSSFPAACQALAAPQDDPWLEKAASNLRAGSPTSAALIHRQWLNGQRLSLADTFRQELIVSVQCARHHDFIEGVRALLVDKDRKPVWQPALLEEVSEEVVAGHYVEPWTGRHPLADLEYWRS